MGMGEFRDMDIPAQVVKKSSKMFQNVPTFPKCSNISKMFQHFQNVPKFPAFPKCSNISKKLKKFQKFPKKARSQFPYGTWKFLPIYLCSAS
jgi:hypothetical protein